MGGRGSKSGRIAVAPENEEPDEYFPIYPETRSTEQIDRESREWLGKSLSDDLHAGTLPWREHFGPVPEWYPGFVGEWDDKWGERPKGV